MKTKIRTLTIIWIVALVISTTASLESQQAVRVQGRQADLTGKIYLPSLVFHENRSLVADHRVVDEFARIPDAYIQAASQVRMLFRHASVGYNISQSLDCLMNNFTDRPAYCDSGLPPELIYYDPKYDRTNWIFEFHAPPPGQNPGWYNKVDLFVERIDALAPDEAYDVIGFKFGYVDGHDGSLIDELFFHNAPDDPYPSIEDIESLESAHPEKRFFYWTMSLARAATIDSRHYNQQMRLYARARAKILLDIADIQSHRPDGTPCYDVGGNGIEAICDEYTDEEVSGHPNALGSQRLAKAVWWLMARIAGWEG